MSTTAHELPVTRSEPSPQRPDRRVLGEPRETSVVWGIHVETEAFIALADASTGQVADRPSAGPFVADVDSDGVWIVQDVIGAVYGAGATYDEARAEFEAALNDHLHFLRGHRDELHARLQDQLPVLERLFPGR